jgi:hypothetical protein
LNYEKDRNYYKDIYYRNADFFSGFNLRAMVDSIVESVRKQLLDRSNVGIKKYGVTLDRDDLSLLDWLEHAKQESMDQVLYLERAIQEIKRQNENIDSKSSILFGQPNLTIDCIIHSTDLQGECFKCGKQINKS